jgi:hypothetical protein
VIPRVVCRPLLEEGNLCIYAMAGEMAIGRLFYPSVPRTFRTGLVAPTPTIVYRATIKDVVNEPCNDGGIMGVDDSIHSTIVSVVVPLVDRVLTTRVNRTVMHPFRHGHFAPKIPPASYSSSSNHENPAKIFFVVVVVAVAIK